MKTNLYRLILVILIVLLLTAAKPMPDASPGRVPAGSRMTSPPAQVVTVDDNRAESRPVDIAKQPADKIIGGAAGRCLQYVVQTGGARKCVKWVKHPIWPPNGPR
jgi:hypothetical protein